MTPYKAHPLRIQRKRTKGWRMPEGAVVVSRPTKWGNPFEGEQAVAYYRRWLTEQASAVFEIGGDTRLAFLPHWSLPAALRESLHELRGKQLACFCPLDRPCHADVLAELANNTEDRQ